MMRFDYFELSVLGLHLLIDEFQGNVEWKLPFTIMPRLTECRERRLIVWNERGKRGGIIRVSIHCRSCFVSCSVQLVDTRDTLTKCIFDLSIFSSCVACDHNYFIPVKLLKCCDERFRDFRARRQCSSKCGVRSFVGHFWLSTSLQWVETRGVSVRSRKRVRGKKKNTDKRRQESMKRNDTRVLWSKFKMIVHFHLNVKVRLLYLSSGCRKSWSLT